MRSKGKVFGYIISFVLGIFLSPMIKPKIDAMLHKGGTGNPQ